MTADLHPYRPYEIVGVLGEGAFATIYRVKHMHLGSTHALKVLSSSEGDLAARFLQEGKIQAQLRHRNIVAVTDVLVRGPHEIGLVMELVEGPTLADVIRLRKAMPQDEALRLFQQILTGVAAAHAAGVLHRDLKPTNILLASEGKKRVVKITDFGLARTESTQDGLTGMGYGVGSPGYMAPEQAKDAKHADARADLFSLGAILYELLSGKPAFPAQADVLDTIRASMEGRYVPLEELVPDCPPHLVAAVHKALSARREDRYGTCDDLAFALFGEELDDDPPSLPIAIGNLAEGSRQLEAHARQTAPPRPWLAVVVGALTGAALALLVVWLSTR